MELDGRSVPRLVTAKGTSSAGPLDDTLILEGAASRLIRNGATQQIAAAEGAAYVANNLFWPVVFLLSRYDIERGGRQQAPVLPTLLATLEYQYADTLAPVDPTFVPHTFHRYSLALGPTPIVVWTDDRGRMAAVMVAAARLMVIDTRHAAYADALANAGGVSAAGLTTPPDHSAHADAAFTAEEVAIDAGDCKLAARCSFRRARARRTPPRSRSPARASRRGTRDSRFRASRPMRRSGKSQSAWRRPASRCCGWMTAASAALRGRRRWRAPRHRRSRMTCAPSSDSSAHGVTSMALGSRCSAIARAPSSRRSSRAATARSPHSCSWPAPPRAVTRSCANRWKTCCRAM
jgi:hypothetical protein